MNAQQAVNAPAAQTQPAAPAAASQASPSAPLVEIQTPEGPRLEPVAAINQRLATLSEAERRIVEQNTRIVNLERDNQALALRARFGDELRQDLIDSPENFVAKAERLARLANGQATDEDKAAVAKGHAPQTEQVLREMRAELQKVQEQLAGDRTVSDIGAALSPYDLFKNNPKARLIAETTLAAMRVASPSTPVQQLASTLHTQMVELVNGNAQQTYQTRVERQTTMPPAPSGHTPGMTSPEPPPKVADIGNGTLRRRMMAFIQGPHGIQQ